MKAGLEFEKIAYERRTEILDMVYRAKSGHIGGDMSCIDALVVLYYGIMDVGKMQRKDSDADHFILSKGHCAEALYTVLADRGFFAKERLKTYAEYGTRLAEHPTHGLEGIDMATGALGHGLAAGCGMALAKKRGGSNGHIYTLMGDGEQAEGSIWEAAMFAAHYKLDNLTAIIDANGLQISGTTKEVMDLGSLSEKYNSFGWQVAECDGHDYEAMQKAFLIRKKDMPVVVILHTVKGKGSVLMENDPEWHHLIPTKEQYEQIKLEFERHIGGTGNGERVFT